MSIVDCLYDPLSLEISFPDIGFSETIGVQCLEPNSTYYIMIDGSLISLQGFFDITISENTDVNPSAPNDECIDAIALGTVPNNGSIPAGTDYYNYCAETDLGEPEPFGIDQTVWFTFTTPDDGINELSSVTINLLNDPNSLGDQIDLQAAVYTSDNGNCSGVFTEIDSEYNAGSFNETLELTCLEPGQQYYLQVDGSGVNTEGYFQIEIIDDGGSMPAPNDDICDATSLGTVPNGGTLNTNTTYTNLCASTETDEPDPGFGLGSDDIDQTVWFTFTPPSSGNVTIDAISDLGENVDLQLAVYVSADGTCSPSQMIPIQHEWNGGSLDETLEITCLSSSLTYYLQVDGSSVSEDLQSGNFTLTMTDAAGSSMAPPNNDICDAQDFGTIAGTETLTNQTNECANLELGEPGIFDYAQQTVWYEFIAPPSGHIIIEVDPDNNLELLPQIYLFGTDGTSCDFADLALVDSEIFPNSSSQFTLETSCIIPGDTYYIQVDGQALFGTAGQFDMSITDVYPNYAATLEPPNNECFGAINLMVQAESCFVGDGIWDFENYGFPTVSLNDSIVQSCNPNGNCGDTWYCFTLPSSGTVLIEGEDDNGSIIGDNSDLTVIAYTGDCNTGLIPLDCEMGGTSADVSYEIEAEPGSKVYLQVFDGGGDDHGEDFALCISEQCGADNCNFAVQMQPDTIYCWNTASATGENIGNGDPGYLECGDGSNPEHSIYFSFTSNCNGGSATVTLFDIMYEDGNPGYIPCDNFLGIETPLDGFTFTVFADATPCDNVEDDLIYCEVFSGCEHNTNNDNFTFTFQNLNPFTDYIIQIDGGIVNGIDGEVGGNVQGQIMIEVEPLPEIDSMVIVDSILCYGGLANVTAIVNPDAYPFTFNWDDVSMDSIYMNVAPGWHYLTVTGYNGCEETDSIFVPEPTELFANVSLDSILLCNGDTTSITSLGMGGTVLVDYTYEWNTVPIQTTAVATGLEAGIYTVTITDDNLCTATASLEIIGPPVIIPAVTILQQISCNGGADGSVEATASGGVEAGTYDFEWNTVPVQNTAIATGLSAGTYIVTVIDDNACSDTISITLTEPEILVPDVSLVQNVSCNGGADGEAEASATGGTIATDYTYEWSTNPIQNTAIATGLSVGIYTVTVTDDNACSDTISIEITEPTAIVPMAIALEHVSCNGGSDGEAEASATGGTEALDYDYEWSTTPLQNTPIATGLSAGIYTVTITDDNNCSNTTTVEITEPDIIVPDVIVLQHVPCSGGSDGEAEASATGGTISIDYSYEWSTVPVQNTATATGLSVGTYTVTIRDDNNCTSTISVDITEPSLIVPSVNLLQDVSCNGGADGEAEASATGGTIATDYTYEWSTVPVQNTAMATGLNVGTYTVTITDDNNCTSTISIDINEPPLLVPAVSLVQDVSCFGGSDGSAEASATGGTIALDYTYQWSTNPVQNTAIANGLSAGSYTVTITDDNDCSEIISITINEPDELVPAVAVLQDVSCFGGSDGSAEASATGGLTAVDYTYEWNTIPVQNTAIATGLSVGTYTVIITDDNNCSSSISVAIIEPDLLVSSVTLVQNVSCNGGSDGSAVAAATGGTNTIGYTYEWSTVPVQNTATATDLSVGTYTVTVTDDNNCSSSISINIIEPSLIIPSVALVQNVSCNGGSDGEAVASATGGTGTNYTYEWNTVPVQNTATASNLSAGTYTVIISDENNCTSSTSIDIDEPEILLATATLQQDVLCNGESNGSAIASATGGTILTDYTYAWSTNPIQTTAIAIGLSAGTYTVTITDDNACSDVATIVINEPDLLIPEVLVLQDVTCNGGSDGSAVASATGGLVAIDYTYEWNTDPVQNTAIASDLSMGTYTVTITDDNNCSTSIPVVINEPIAVDATENITMVSCFGGSDGSIEITPATGIPPYTYNWSIGSGNPNINLSSGNYTVTVTDLTGCTFVQTYFVDEYDEIIINTAIIDTKCTDTPDGSISISVTGGTGTYTYTWDGAATGQGATANNLPIGNYNVTVSDTNNCTKTESFTINAPPELIVDLGGTTPANCFGCDGTAIINVSGGTSPYSYSWSNGNTEMNPNDLCFGTNSVTVTDENGCVDILEIDVDSINTLLIDTIMATDAYCFDAADGEAIVIPQNGAAPYNYLWDTATNSQMTQTATSLDIGDYTVTVIDDNGCEAIGTTSISEPPPLEISLNSIKAKCFGESSGMIIVEESSGGVPPHMFAINNTTNFSTDTIFVDLPSDLHTVYIQDDNGCIDSLQIHVDQTPELLLTTIPMDTLIELGDSLELLVLANQGDVTYAWTPSGTLSCDSCANPVTYTTSTVEYNIVVTDTINGCVATTEILIRVDKDRDIYIPNAFSPNADGYNDFFSIYSDATSVANIKYFRLFDRWGELMFARENFQPNIPSLGWDGNFRGKKVNPAVFVYVAEIEFVDGQTRIYKGDFTLVR